MIYHFSRLMNWIVDKIFRVFLYSFPLYWQRSSKWQLSLNFIPTEVSFSRLFMLHFCRGTLYRSASFRTCAAPTSSLILMLKNLKIFNRVRSWYTFSPVSRDIEWGKNETWIGSNWEKCTVVILYFVIFFVKRIISHDLSIFSHESQ